MERKINKDNLNSILIQHESKKNIIEQYVPFYLRVKMVVDPKIIYMSDTKEFLIIILRI